MRPIAKSLRSVPAYNATKKTYITCPVCKNPQVEVEGLPPYQTLARHYVPATQYECKNYGKDYRELT